METKELITLLTNRKAEKARMGVVGFNKPLENKDGDKVKSVGYMPENETLYVNIKFKNRRDYYWFNFEYLDSDTKELILNNVK